MIRKSGFFHYPINLGLPAKVGNVELAAADRFYIRQRGPDKVLTPAFLAARTAAVCLVDLVGTFFPKVSD